MATTQRQQTTSGGSVTGLSSALSPGSRRGVGSPKIMRSFPAVKKPGSTLLWSASCSDAWLALAP